MSPNVTAREAERILELSGSHYLLIVDCDDVVGIVCASDLRTAERDTALSACMRAPVLGICDRASLEEAARLMRDTGIGCLPVFWNNGRLLGLVTRDDVRSAGCC